jgi:hypothetical protein
MKLVDLVEWCEGEALGTLQGILHFVSTSMFLSIEAEALVESRAQLAVAFDACWLDNTAVNFASLLARRCTHYRHVTSAINLGHLALAAGEELLKPSGWQVEAEVLGEPGMKLVDYLEERNAEAFDLRRQLKFFGSLPVLLSLEAENLVDSRAGLDAAVNVHRLDDSRSNLSLLLARRCIHYRNVTSVNHLGHLALAAGEELLKPSGLPTVVEVLN